MQHIEASVTPQVGSTGGARILHECALHRSPALVLNLESRMIADAEFMASKEESLILGVFSGSSNLYPAGSPCSVAFAYGDFSRIFLARVLAFRERPAPEPSHLEIEAPLQIAAAKGHIRYRVPVFKDSGLQVYVSSADRRLPGARALNLSLTGILIEFAETGDPHLPVGATLQAMLDLAGNKLTLAGEVVRTQGHQYGIFFRDTRKAGIDDPPEPLRRIVRMLERAWLRQRVDAADRGSGA